MPPCSNIGTCSAISYIFNTVKPLILGMSTALHPFLGRCWLFLVTGNPARSHSRSWCAQHRHPLFGEIGVSFFLFSDTKSRNCCKPKTVRRLIASKPHPHLQANSCLLKFTLKSPIIAPPFPSACRTHCQCGIRAVLRVLRCWGSQKGLPQCCLCA